MLCGNVENERKDLLALYLASASPRRRELLELAGFAFTVEPAEIDENLPEPEPAKLVVELAKQKAKAVALQHPQDTVLAADTVVALDGQILGKPRDAVQARAMLEKLSGRMHTVWTGYCIQQGARQVSGICCTDVYFYELTPAEIEGYIETGEPMDKAGAYGIQGKGALLVRKIHGDFYNVVGLPIAVISRLLRDF